MGSKRHSESFLHNNYLKTTPELSFHIRFFTPFIHIIIQILNKHKKWQGGSIKTRKSRRRIKEYKTTKSLPEGGKYQTPAKIILQVRCLKFRQFNKSSFGGLFHYLFNLYFITTISYEHFFQACSYIFIYRRKKKNSKGRIKQEENIQKTILTQKGIIKMINGSPSFTKSV